MSKYIQSLFVNNDTDTDIDAKIYSIFTEQLLDLQYNLTPLCITNYYHLITLLCSHYIKEIISSIDKNDHINQYNYRHLCEFHTQYPLQQKLHRLFYECYKSFFSKTGIIKCYTSRMHKKFNNSSPLLHNILKFCIEKLDAISNNIETQEHNLKNIKSYFTVPYMLELHRDHLQKYIKFQNIVKNNLHVVIICIQHTLIYNLDIVQYQSCIPNNIIPSAPDFDNSVAKFQSTSSIITPLTNDIIPCVPVFNNSIAELPSTSSIITPITNYTVPTALQINTIFPEPPSHPITIPSDVSC